VLKRKLLNDQTSYTFHPKANIHKGSDVYNPNYLMAGDQVRIYTIDGKIVEMEKL
jgi:hypothetical protein